jgi:hypothetical protein
VVVGIGYIFRMFRPVSYRRFDGTLPSTPPSLKQADWFAAEQVPEQRVLDEREQVSVVVGRLREVAGALERGRHAEARDVAAPGARCVFVAVEEEQLVAAARLADGTADGVAEILLVDLRLRVAVEHVRAAVAVPVGVALHVIDGAAEPVRSALRDRGDLQAARTAVLRLVV